ncbi:MAG: energy-coupling factor transporter ATPase [Lachnospiraceae bacterium]|nr:energy-coupling factor transporter ATPase [Lachnospiraceae bacterium]
MSLILDHVNYTYDTSTSMSHDALRDINLNIKDGEFIGLIGHTGSGKSTLVQTMNGLLKPTGGNIYYDGADINDSDYDRRALRGKVGLVFQYPEHQLFEETVFKDVCFGPKNLGLTEKEINLRSFDALEKVHLEHEYFYQSPFDLSGGQKRRVAIAGVLAMKPKVLILDEPTAGLDPKGRDEILGLISKIHEETNMTVILVSHSMEDVANYVDRIIVMNKGEVFMDGTPKEVFTHPDELEKIGLAVPEVTYIVRELKERGLNVDTTVTTLQEAKETILKALEGR